MKARLTELFGVRCFSTDSVEQTASPSFIAGDIVRITGASTEAEQILIVPPLNCRVGELKLLCVGYQYPKDAKMLDFDMICYRLTQLIAKDLVCNRAILFTINDGDSYINTIEAKLYVKRPENVDGYEEI